MHPHPHRPTKNNLGGEAKGKEQAISYQVLP